MLFRTFWADLQQLQAASQMKVGGVGRGSGSGRGSFQIKHSFQAWLQDEASAKELFLSLVSVSARGYALHRQMIVGFPFMSKTSWIDFAEYALMISGKWFGLKFYFLQRRHDWTLVWLASNGLFDLPEVSQKVKSTWCFSTSCLTKNRSKLVGEYSWNVEKEGFLLCIRC